MAINDSQRKLVNGVMCDSTEEEHMVYWLDEALELGLISRLTHKPYTLPINDKVKYNGLKLTRTCNKKSGSIQFDITPDAFATNTISQSEYTPDFETYLTDAGLLVLGGVVHLNAGRRWIVDVKGAFSGGANNVSGVKFPLKQVLTHQRYGVVVQKIVPIKFFYRTWLPQRCKYTPKQGKVCKAFTKKAKPYPEREDVVRLLGELVAAGVLTTSHKLTDWTVGKLKGKYDC